MKIISKYKDYYDFISGIYGSDPKIILDRRGNFKKPIILDKSVFKIYLCGMIYDGYYQDGKCYYGTNVKRFSLNGKHRIFWDDKRKYFSVAGGYVYIEPYKDKKNINEKVNCPILLITYERSERYNIVLPLEDFYQYPILRDFDFGSVVSAKEIYLMLSEWLAPRDSNADNRTNKEKIITNGFDLKTSFRNV